MSKNNDEIFNDLEILEEYAHVVPAKALRIVQFIVDNKHPQKAKITHLKGWGKFPGKSQEDLLVQGVKILSKIKYLETRKVIKSLERLYQRGGKTVKSEVLKVFTDASRYDLFALQQIGYKTQNLILNEIKKWSDRKIIKNLEVLIIITEELLNPTFEGSSWPDYKTLTFHSGVLTISDDLKAIRKGTIALLKRIYLLPVALLQKIKIIQTLREATQTPHSHSYCDDMEQMITEDVKDIIDFYLEILPKAENEIIQEVEEQKIWFTKRYKEKLLKKISELDEVIRSNSAYDMFRVFVGYDGRLDQDYDFNRDRETRSQKINDFISDISDSNFEEWRRKILTVVKNYSAAEPGSYGYFETFLSELGSKKPNLGVLLIQKNEKELAPFLINLLSGIWKSDLGRAKEMISGWVDKGKYLYVWAFIFVAVDDFDEELFGKIINKAKKSKDTRALNNILRSILHHYPGHKNLRPTFFEIVKELAKRKDIQWVENLWFKSGSILSDFNKREVDVILDSLLIPLNIGYQGEEILKLIAEKYPEKIITFFRRRVEIKSKKKRNLSDRYDAVPFNFYKLGEVLKKHEKIIVPILLKWYEGDDKKQDWLFGWEASHLFEEIFPAFSPILEQSLIDLIKGADKHSRDIVFSILGKYKGEEFLWGVVRALVKQYIGTKEYKEVQGRLFGCLSQTGVVSGEDGFVRAYQSKKQEIQNLKKDPDQSVKKFAKEYDEYLDKLIIDETKKTNEEIELMKRGLRT